MKICGYSRELNVNGGGGDGTFDKTNDVIFNGCRME